MRTLGQKRAEFALNRVLKVTQDMDEKKKKEFKSFTAGAPSMILQNGFGQTLAFWLSKKSDKHLAVFDMVVEWLSYDNGKDIRNTFATKKERREFMKELSEMNQPKYLTAQKETLALLEWVKRFVNADL
ncbi:MAG: type III-B CRISPR module-associated protein Cmr5 [Deltaproteobacteria bacterium]|nr:type III-B CRISPR module-associated protein Cmr5 [Deltaproteobacteria bacterium]